MIQHRKMAHILATLIALTAWAGLTLQFIALLPVHSMLGALWTMSRFFTITTNLAIALIFSAIAIGRSQFTHSRLLAGLTLSILLVGIVYALLLQGVMIPKGLGIPANFLMHKITPVLVPLYWLGFVRKGDVRRGDPVWWASYPFAYLFYALARGLGGDKYAYPFIDPAQHGWHGVAIYVTVIAAGFLVAGYGLFWLDRSLAARGR
jgi:hypothetical protein